MQVKIVGATYGQDGDWVGVFAPEDISPNGALLRFPMRYQHATTTCWPRAGTPLLPNATCVAEACCAANNYDNYGRPGYGEATLGFQLVNLRSDYVFALVQGSGQFPTTVAVSNPVAFKRPAGPTQIHLALTALPHQMRVSWTSANISSFASKPAGIKWGRSPGTFDEGSAVASAGTYRAEQMCSSGGPARTLGWRDPGLLWSAVASPLLPGVQYYYTVGSDAGGWSHERNWSESPLSFVGPNQDAKAVS